MKPKFQLVWDSYPTTQTPCDGPWINQCAIRVSIALEGAGMSFDMYATGPKCEHGHPRGAQSLRDHLWRVWGSPKTAKGEAKARALVDKKKGILFFQDIAGFRGGLGDHIDMWNGTRTKTGEYFAECREVSFWELIV